MRYWSMRVLKSRTDIWMALTDDGLPAGFFNVSGKPIPADFGDHTLVDDNPTPPAWATDAVSKTSCWQDKAWTPRIVTDDMVKAISLDEATRLKTASSDPIVQVKGGG